jgi:hypothetical protein
MGSLGYLGSPSLEFPVSLPAQKDVAFGGGGFGGGFLLSADAPASAPAFLEVV